MDQIDFQATTWKYLIFLIRSLLRNTSQHIVGIIKFEEHLEHLDLSQLNLPHVPSNPSQLISHSIQPVCNAVALRYVRLFLWFGSATRFIHHHCWDRDLRQTVSCNCKSENKAVHFLKQTNKQGYAGFKWFIEYKLNINKQLIICSIFFSAFF